MSPVTSLPTSIARQFIIATVIVAGILASLPPAFAADAANAVSKGAAAPVYNIRLRTDSTPDLTDIPSYLHSITSQYSTPQEQAIAIWRWSQKLRKQTSNPSEDGHEVLDPISLFNSYGHCNCGIVSGVNNTMWLNMGWKAHYVQLGDHTVCEASWDGGKTWHMFDASMSFYCFNDDKQVASVTEIEKNPRFYFENFAPECGTNPVKGPNDHQGWRQASDRPVRYQRTLANGWDSFKAPNSIISLTMYAQWGQKFALNLRPDESYTRYFDHIEDPQTKTFRPLKNGTDVEKQHGHRGLHGNGRWVYEPNLRSPSAAQLVYDTAGLKWGDNEPGFAVRPASGEPGSVTFRVTAANVVAAAKLSLRLSRADKDTVKVEVSRTAGTQFQPVWNADKITGNNQPAEIDLSTYVAGASEYLVRINLSGKSVGLESVAIDSTTQINRASLPTLVRGPNRVQLSLGAQVETIQFQPSIVEGRHSQTVFEEKSLDVEKETGFYKPTLRPAENGAPCSATWKISTPTPITGVNYGGSVCVKSPRNRVTFLHSFDGQNFTADYEKSDGSEPFDLMVNKDVKEIPSAARTAYLRYEFLTPNAAKSYSGPGIQMARMTVEHEPKVRGFTPIEVTYCWLEHRTEGDVERSFTQLVEHPAQEFVINVGGFRDPTLKWVRLNLQGSAPRGERVAYGYSDGKDVGPGSAAERALYRFGKNLALGHKYTLTGPQSARNPDAGSDLTDGIIAPPDDSVSEKYMPTNVIFEKDATAVATIDLGQAQEVAAVRVHAGQDLGFHLGFPAKITVETSTDGQTFQSAGVATHNQVFSPPADFQPWEDDNSPQFAALPAGGRLAYAYRVIFDKPTTARYVRVSCQSQSGWGLLLSEIQAFDKVEVDKNLPPAVLLPPLARK